MGNKLYPKDPRKRAKIDSILFWTLGLHEDMVKAIIYKLFGFGEVTDEAIQKVKDSFKLCNTMYEGKDLNDLHIGDYLVANYVWGAFEPGYHGMKLADYPNLEKFMDAMEKVDGFKDFYQESKAVIASKIA